MQLPYLLCWAASCLLFLPGPVGAQPANPFEERLRQLEKTIAAVRNLEFKEPVRARIIARPANGAKQIQGYYDPKEKTLFLYNDLAGNYEKGVLIHEMVHALQDQHFDLTKLKATLHADQFGSDAELALAALIEGDATFTMIEVLKKEQPKVAAMLDMPLEKAKNLSNAFLYAQGARYVKMLKDKGGWANVNFAYKFPPRTTANIFHLQSIAAIDLGPGPSQGAFALWRLFTLRPETKPLALALAKSWRGDRTVTYPEGQAWIIACASAIDAQRLTAAFWEAFCEEDRGLEWTPAGDLFWRQAQGKFTAVLTQDRRVVVVSAAATAQAAQKIDERVRGPLGLTVYCSKDQKTISFGDLIEHLLEADVICIGESHDHELHHRVQHQLVKALHCRDERLGVGLEMFQKPFQPALDRFRLGQTEEATFLHESEFALRWGYDWSLYKPILNFCRHNRIPLAALNAPRELTRRISMAGYLALDDKEKQQLGLIDFHQKEHRAHWFERLAKMHGETKVSAERQERSYQVMAVWDDFMARTAAEFIKERQLRRLVILAGSGHIERGFGIPNRVARYAGVTVATIGVQVAPQTKAKNEERLTDYVVIVR